MSNFSPVRVSWSDGDVPVGADFTKFDVDHVKTINASDGSTHAPTSVITIGGSGVQLALADYPTFVTAKTLTRAVAFVGGTNTLASTFVAAGTGVTSPLNFASGLIRSINDALVDGCTLASIDVDWQVGHSHSGVPVTRPKLRVYQRPTAGAVFASLNSTDPTNLGIAMGSAASGAAYYNGGSVQTFTYTCDTNNVLVNKALYDYAVWLTDEDGTNSLLDNIFHGMRLNMSAIAAFKHG